MENNVFCVVLQVKWSKL